MPIIRLIIFIFILSIGLNTFADIKNSENLETWLKQNEKHFATCEPKKSSTYYILCDKTEIPIDQLKKLFSMESSDVVSFLQKESIKVDIICDKNSKAKLSNSCIPESGDKMFAKITSLHGKYISENKRILIRSSASKGSLIHEYIHYLQSENNNMVYGIPYKKTRNRIQKQLIEDMDKQVEIIQALEKSGEKAKLPPHLKKFMAANTSLMGYSKYQDLIDERNIFLLFIKFKDELKIADEDIKLAKKNIGFICKRKDLKNVLSASTCEIAN